ncbi:hypothetical protein [Bradyrhizobium sp. F1.13.3]|uniref:hypothetical protein n=1 Tax=Bradyrhizobium sp. F1.13.3 TaxID=3156351 RepID=UPI00339B0321
MAKAAKKKSAKGRKKAPAKKKMSAKRKASSKKAAVKLNLTHGQKRQIKKKTGKSVKALSLTEVDLKRNMHIVPYD